MPRRTILPLAIVVSLLTIAPTVRAELPQAHWRYTGVGWSDGYHSRAACPPKRHLLHHAPPAGKPIPWWAIPAADAEQLPAPATNEPATSRSPQPTGPSLFRHPGEGSSVGAPSIMR